MNYTVPRTIDQPVTKTEAKMAIWDIAKIVAKLPTKYQHSDHWENSTQGKGVRFDRVRYYGWEQNGARDMAKLHKTWQDALPQIQAVLDTLPAGSYEITTYKVPTYGMICYAVKIYWQARPYNRKVA
jgi:hypothetical protein